MSVPISPLYSFYDNNENHVPEGPYHEGICIAWVRWQE